MPHVVIAGKLHQSGLDLIEAADGVTFDYVEEISEPSYAGLMAGADGLVIRTQPLSAKTIGLGERLRIVSRHGVGYDAVDVEALNARGIPLAIVGDVNSRSVAEHTMMLILSALKQQVVAHRAVTKDWPWRNYFLCREAGGKTLLLLGFGRIGRLVAKMALAFDMSVMVYDPYFRGGVPESVVLVTELAEGLAQADVVSVHAPSTGKALLGETELAQVKPGCLVVNTARGGVIDEAALIAALRDGRVGHAALDVFADEPPDAANPLFAMERVTLSPHVAGLTVECAERMAVASVRNVLDFFEGRLDPNLVVNGVFEDAG